MDGTGSDDRNRRRKFGYGIRGKPPLCHRILHHGRRMSAITEMSTYGLVSYDLVHGSVNGERFIQLLQGKLIPEMLLYDGENPLHIGDGQLLHSPCAACPGYIEANGYSGFVFATTQS